ncbi:MULTISPECIES: Smr/MutS family protein [unclassified Mycoplasma]|uniref:Smr/MutS family protein n=1 Tax=unclassified Mycoplasma TaxID=2683645 RepID=UPI00211C020D|nr:MULTISPECIES: Smr/MutS family protein [unclassified Mycoplasma]UUM19563.1 Smr/MutS family protein [Mycoplasma sp. 1578d]UUM24482.1 Smr/MutS family protein [Mycoplasma sp. 3686d]
MFKKLEIDLHGYEWIEAQNKILLLIDDLKKFKVDKVLFITGKGTGALITQTTKLLDDHLITWELVNNNGAVLAYIHNSRDNWAFWNHYQTNSRLDQAELEEIFNVSLNEFKKLK